LSDYYYLKKKEASLPLSGMVKHVFPLEQYRDALSVARNRRARGSIKVLFDPKA